MNYSFYVAQSAAAPAPRELPGLQQQVLASYDDAFERVYRGNRAPLIVGNHFAPWNGGIYRQALSDFMLDVCSQPDVRCVSFAELADWLDSQPAQRLAHLLSLPAATPAGLPAGG